MTMNDSQLSEERFVVLEHMIRRLRLLESAIRQFRGELIKDNKWNDESWNKAQNRHRNMIDENLGALLKIQIKND